MVMLKSRLPPAPSSHQHQHVKQAKKPAALLGRRAALGAALIAAGLAAQRPAQAIDDAAGGMAISITPAPSGVKEYLERRDEAAANKCPGGMFDCDGDRREYAKQQWEDFVASGGTPKRLRDGNGKGGPRSF